MQENGVYSIVKGKEDIDKLLFIHIFQYCHKDDIWFHNLYHKIFIWVSPAQYTP